MPASARRTSLQASLPGVALASPSVSVGGSVVPVVAAGGVPVAPPTPPSGVGVGVGGATGTPPAATTGTTLPPTDTLGDAGAAPGSDAWRLVLLALAGTLAAALLLTPARAVRKDR